MAKGFDGKTALMFLYDAFGEELVACGVQKGKEAINAYAGEGHKPKEQPSPVFEKDKKHSSDSDDKATQNYIDADAFEESSLDNIQRTAVAVVVNPYDVSRAVSEMILFAAEVRKFEEAQVTVRTEIAARRDIALANIEIQKTALLTYLDKSFDERKANFEALFSIVDESLEKGNMQALAMSLDGIIKLAESSPFKDLATIESAAAALTNPDHKWDF